MERTQPTRKSCDLCYRRKMKCDGQKPRCSHCVTYEIDCTYTAPKRTSTPKKRKIDAKGANDRVGNTNTQDRLGRLESLVQQVTERLDVVEKNNESEPLIHQHEEVTSALPAVVMASKISRSEDDSRAPKSMVLPPLEHVLSTIQTFLRDFNSVLPLFDADTLLRLVHSWYSTEPQQRDPVAWAAINVVLALAQLHNPGASHDIPSPAACLSRAESVLSKIVLGEMELLNIQVLVGMVMLLQASQDHNNNNNNNNHNKPALILIATTIRLAHSIGLHDQSYSTHLDAAHARQRAHVFWLAYILDKDLSMRAKQPAIQLDDDINLDLPSPTIAILHSNNDDDDRSSIRSDDDTTTTTAAAAAPAPGIITTTNGTTKMNYPTARIQLAAIQGAVYDYIFSTRSRKRSPAERSLALQSVDSALEQWKASIPSEFHAIAAAKSVASKAMQGFLAAMHSMSIACTSLVNQAHAWDAEWIASIRRYGSLGIEPLLPRKWEGLVGEARGLLVLDGELGGVDCWNVWTSGCSYVTAMVLLVANTMHRLNHGDVCLDRHLVETGLLTVGRMAEETRNETWENFYTTCTELHQLTQKRCAEAAAIMANNNIDYYL